MGNFTIADRQDLAEMGKLLEHISSSLNPLKTLKMDKLWNGMGESPEFISDTGNFSIFDSYKNPYTEEVLLRSMPSTRVREQPKEAKRKQDVDILPDFNNKQATDFPGMEPGRQNGPPSLSGNCTFEVYGAADDFDIMKEPSETITPQLKSQVKVSEEVNPEQYAGIYDKLLRDKEKSQTQTQPNNGSNVQPLNTGQAFSNQNITNSYYPPVQTQNTTQPPISNSVMSPTSNYIQPQQTNNANYSSTNQPQATLNINANPQTQKTEPKSVQSKVSSPQHSSPQKQAAPKKSANSIIIR